MPKLQCARSRAVRFFPLKKKEKEEDRQIFLFKKNKKCMIRIKSLFMDTAPVLRSCRQEILGEAAA